MAETDEAQDIAEQQARINELMRQAGWTRLPTLEELKAAIRRAELMRAVKESAKRAIDEANERRRERIESKRRDNKVFRSGEKLSRAKAKAASLLTYAGGKPCPHGHANRRWVSNGACVTCSRDSARKTATRMRNRERKRLAELRPFTFSMG